MSRHLLWRCSPSWPAAHITVRCCIICYHTIDLYQPWKIARGRADIVLATGVYRPQRMRQRRTSLIGRCAGRCRQRTTASQICKHRSRRSIVLPFSKVVFNIFQIIFAYLFRRVRSYDKELITRLFSYRHLYQASGRHQPSTSSRADVCSRAWYRCRYEDSRVITSKYSMWPSAACANRQSFSAANIVPPESVLKIKFEG